jgi:site-specific DNA-methyltransferase (adenine-specific)
VNLAAIPRLDKDSPFRSRAESLCRLEKGEIWVDPVRGHRVAVADAACLEDVRALCSGVRLSLVVTDPPYNIAVGKRGSKALPIRSVEEYTMWCREWVANVSTALHDHGFLYVWLGADQDRDFQPLPDFMIMMRDFPEFRARSYITMRNQRGYGTQRNWMFVRQELLCYTKGKPDFTVTYTDIPKILRGYYKTVGGLKTENMERSRSETIRPGNVWVDVQQVFYRMEENVAGAYAQKPLKSIDRIVRTSSSSGDVVADFFSHSGTTLLAAEMLGRRCLTCDLDPVFAELTIRRLEHYRLTGKTGWQGANPFPEIDP